MFKPYEMRRKGKEDQHAEMGPLFIIMFLATVIHQSTGVNFTLYSNLSTVKIEVQNKILEHHNNIRRSVIPAASNMLKMEWSSEVASNAQMWANECKMKNSGFSVRAINDTECGENIFGSSFPASWDDVILGWKLQKRNFIYGLGGINENHNFLTYIQMVWYRTYKIGCGFSQCPNNKYKYIYVCQYYPGRNEGTSLMTPYKKGDRCADCPHSCENGLCTNPCQYEDKYTNCQNLKDQLTCDFTHIKLHCEASCKCTSEIK
ncbi:cysteine-rich venom protein-like [Trichosurus vulpecula]|uniref:cysteine-rich venom protein-like n=1 Tax=Trichosurus vulpecula TaxID=9337 RepID=UPI00186B47E0|nr:cysteine-rich venom protein-like [Trichosurus vulpecula]